MLQLREDIKKGSVKKAQFPMGDYAYLMESLAAILSIPRFEPDGKEDSRSGIVFPARYLPSNASEKSRAEAKKALDSIDRIFAASKEKGLYVARAIFRGMQGDWKLERSLDSSIASYPSGKFSGTAKILPRKPTAEGFDKEYLYVEEGDFTTENGLAFKANRRYFALHLHYFSMWLIS